MQVEAPTYALAVYRGPARRIVLAYKDGGRRDLAPELGALLAEACVRLQLWSHVAAGGLCIVPVPSRSSVARRRGGEHMHRLARHCARELTRNGRGAAALPALRLAPGARDAVGLDRAGRAANVAGRVRLVGDAVFPQAAVPPVVLIDDVVTTGATSQACVRVLRSAGIAVDAVLALTSPQA